MGVECPKCKTENTSDSEFCKKCATPLPSSKEIPVTETLETPTKELTRGTIFASRYEIIEELGKGGMGKVYRVEDKKIKEEVALKLIKPEIASDKKTIERFSNELKMARKIRHKNVCGMYDLGEEKGTHYITMEYVPGEDLKGMIRMMGQLGAGKSISIAKQVCEGLAEAHRLGVVHRDLKPSNIMIDKEGNVRIMDFGIARSLTAKGITGAGVMIGTPEYMSPEQAEVKEVDQRSDIYSLGVILYEMVTGRVPFEGETPLGIAMKHKSEMPKDPRELNAQIPEDLSIVVLRCLEKDKENRYKSAGEVRSELTRIEKGIPAPERVVPKRKPITSKEITVTFRLKKLFIPALIVIGLIIIAVVVLLLFPTKERVVPLIEKPSIAVLPFVDLSPQRDQEYFCDGMTDEIIAKLSTLKELKVVSRTSVMRYKNTDKSIKEIGQELDVASVLEGSVRKERDDIRITAQLINVKDGFHLWSDIYDRKLERIFDVQSDVAENIANALKTRLTPEEKKRLSVIPQIKPEAYQAYLKGRFYWNKRTGEDLRKAINYFEKAIEEEPDYALGYVGLADCYNLLSFYSNVPSKESFPMAREAALKAIALDETLAEAHNSLAYATYRYYWDFAGAEREFKRAIELNPNYASARFWHGEFLMMQGRFSEAFREMNLALELDPVSLIINSSFGLLYYFARQPEKAVRQARKTLELDPNFAHAHSVLGGAYDYLNKFPEAIAEIEKAVELSGGSSFYMSQLGWTYAQAGKDNEAKRILEKLKELSSKHYVSPFHIACVYAGLKENDRAFDWLERAYEERYELLITIKIIPNLDPIRTDERFSELLKKIGLE